MATMNFCKWIASLLPVGRQVARNDRRNHGTEHNRNDFKGNDFW